MSEELIVGPAFYVKENFMKSIVKWLIAIVVVISLGGVGWLAYQQHLSHPQITRPQRVEKKHVKLVALGDSLTHGQGDKKKAGGYVSIIKRKIEHHYHKTTVTTVNYGVSGDRSDQILDRLNSQKQLRTDLRSADVITMTVGGNDLMQTLERDVMMQSSSSVQKSVDRAQVTYQQKLTKLFDAVRKENPTAPIFVMSIYNPFYTYFPDVEAINNSISQWNKATASTMKKYHHMYFVDINHLMSYGQYTTKEQRQQLINREQAVNHGKVSQSRALNIMSDKDHNLNDLISTDDNFHPNHRGYEQIANQLFKSMKRHDSWEFTKE